jgi:hypothetical protein
MRADRDKFCAQFLRVPLKRWGAAGAATSNLNAKQIRMLSDNLPLCSKPSCGAFASAAFDNSENNTTHRHSDGKL